MSLTMPQIDGFIDVAINRLSGEEAPLVSSFYVDLRTLQTRITQHLVQECISICERRGLLAEREGDGLTVTVNLNSCRFNPQQSIAYNAALNFTRSIHGNHI